jgi:predicted small metal-binding protein
MTKVLHCGDVMEGCAMVLRGPTEDDVMRQAGEHAGRDHGVSQPTPEMLAQVRSKIRDEKEVASR